MALQMALRTRYFLFFRRFIAYSSILIAILLLTQGEVNAQANLLVNGKVIEGKVKLEGATVTVKKNGATVENIVTANGGKFQFELDLDADYVIEFSKNGYVTKKISVNTKNTPAGDSQYGYEFGGWTVDLFKKIDDLDVSILNKPIGRVMFIPEIDNFDYDVKYTESIHLQLEKLKEDLAAKQERDVKYNAAIAAGDKSLAEKKFEEAKKSYEDAIKIKANQQYPKDKLVEIDKVMAASNKEAEALKAKEAAYKAAIAKADNAFTAKDYSNSKSSYQEASKIKPNETYPKDRIGAIDKLLADQKQKEGELAAKEASYKAAIAKADNAFTAKDYANSKSSYQEASKIKPNETYPKDRIGAIDKLLADQKQKEGELAAKEAEYKALIAKADADFKGKSYDKAKVNYQAALNVKPAEQYPKGRIGEIDALLAQMAKDEAAKKKVEAEQAAKEAEYKALIAKADGFLKSKDYTNAKTNYQSALNIKPTEQYPKGKIGEIDALLDQLAKEEAAKKKALADQAAKEAEYKSLITQGDNDFKAKNYDQSKNAYQRALNIKPAEQYPKGRIAEIDRLLEQMASNEETRKKMEAEKAAKEAEYKSLIAQGDNDFNAKGYDKAKTNYQKALNIKPTEQYPKGRIAEIDKLLAQMANDADAKKKALADQAAKEAEYKSIIAKADNDFKTKSYDNAKTNYQRALNVKPAEQYPKDKISEIDKLVAQLSNDAARQKTEAEKAAREAEYKSFITKADNGFNSKSYELAKTNYQNALNIKPTEQYPKGKIAEIDKLIAMMANDADAQKKVLADQAAKDAEYKSLIAKADNAFNTKSYESAKANYQSALDIQPTAKYPKSKIDEINRIVENMANQSVLEGKKEEMLNAQNEKYNAAISQADEFFNASDYSNAKKKYQEALSIKTTEKYPKDQLAEINNILSQRANKEREEQKRKQTEARLARMEQLNQNKQENIEFDPSSNKKIDMEMMAKMMEEWSTRADIIRKANKEDLNTVALDESNNNLKSYADASTKGNFTKENVFQKQSEYSEQYETSSNMKRQRVKEEMNRYAEEETSLSVQHKEAQNTAKQKLKEETDMFNNAVQTWDNNANGNRNRNKESINTVSTEISSGNENALTASAGKGQKIKEDKFNLQSDFSEQYLTIEELAAKKVKLQMDAYTSSAEELESQYVITRNKEKQEIQQETTDIENSFSQWNNNANDNSKTKKEQIDGLSADISKEEQNAIISAETKSKTQKEVLYNQKMDFNYYESTENDATGKIKELFEAYETISKEQNDRHQESTMLSKQKIDERTKEITLFNEGKATNKEDGFQSDLAEQYPEGVTEEIYEEGTMVITKRIVVKNNQGNEYKRVVHQWGAIYYFKDEVSITEYIWDTKTSLR